MGLYAVLYTMVDVDLNAKHRPEHIEFLKGLLIEEKVVDGMKFPDYHAGGVQGVLICSAKSKEEVQGWFDKDPVILAGARTYVVRDYLPMQVKV